MSTLADLDPSQDLADLQSNASTQDNSTIDDPDKEDGEFDDSAPNWAFASFVAESEELLRLFNNLKPVEHFPRIVLIVCWTQDGST